MGGICEESPGALRNEMTDTLFGTGTLFNDSHFVQELNVALAEREIRLAHQQQANNDTQRLLEKAAQQQSASALPESRADWSHASALEPTADRRRVGHCNFVEQPTESDRVEDLYPRPEILCQPAER